ncbi:DUF1553 domain-containing protein [Aquirufa aurantiipilula]|uniref:DUF1553 domain-containing protein n=1 Tax=Aquirufa aurantiipilula TaxID=2696561 RepID=A0ABT6BIB0_9BACT|nr:DUF1553 domain-containing protein [Aquirufa aurantiipilula]MDF5690200.1 DUF1553 domain-containing protein [Aquirufa aurantiipilula]
MAAKPPKSLPMPADVAMEYRQLPTALDFNIHIKPILSDKCFACHGPDKAKQKAGLRLDLPENAYAKLPESPGKVAITPGNLQKSELAHRILSKDPSYVMPEPKSHLSLSAKEKAILLKWIQDGAVYKPHWAFVKPVKHVIPESKKGMNVIDYWVQTKLEKESLKISAKASKALLLRRLSFDLTGLAPSISELDNFLADNTPNAYEKQVDRLLASPHFGEKMAVDWLDLSRFADSHGYTVDRIRDMSPYRDWVIKSFNNNMPYDTFIHQQLAGDLMPNPSKDMLIATGFNRNHPQNTEGGIVEEEFQAEYVIDRTNTFGEAFMAVSTGCARCHDHKYDPISQKNYYELFSFFNNVREAGQISYSDDLPTPTLMLPTKEKEEVLKFIQTKIQTVEEKMNQSPTSNAPFQNWIKSKGHEKLAEDIIPQRGLVAYFDLDATLKNKLTEKQVAVIKRESGKTGDQPVFVKGKQGQGLAFDGDIYADLSPAGVFRKSEPFTIGMWVNIPKDMKEGVIFHKSNAERLYNFKGFHVYLKNNRLEINMAHTAPSNAINKVMKSDIPRDQWIHLTLTYDGSSKAAGFNLFVDGEKSDMETVIDQLYKDIIYFSKNELGLQIGGWWRGLGFKGGKADEVAIYNRELIPYEIQILAQRASWKELVYKSQDQWTNPQGEAFRAYFKQNLDSNQLALSKEIKHWRTALADSSEKIEEVMIMQEMPQPKKSFLLQRGQYDARGEEVFPNTPQKILPFPANLPKNRLGLAQWLSHENNPLTARVAVNRFWQNFFGTGIVKTSEDFGNQGEMPSHPELLDALAIQFRESAWNIKQMMKQMVMSETYQQDSKATAEQREKDPENRLLARGPSVRLSAEMIRDNALQASGLLVQKIGGKSVYPYQPDGLWEINSSHYKQDTISAVYRRSLYVVVKRSVPNPTLATFDAPARSSCLVRRQKTNTPLQALVGLNDPTFLEAAKILGEQMAAEKDVNKAIQMTFKKLTSREASEKELALLVDLQRKSLVRFQQDARKAKGWLQAGMKRVQGNMDGNLVAANAVVASAIMNSDASITKR